jgi:hypothetical protein
MIPLASFSRSTQAGSVAYKRWSDLSPRMQRLVLIGGVVEGILKIAALVDLARRPSEEVRGSKRWWAAAIVLINSAGAAPITYFAYGRKRS